MSENALKFGDNFGGIIDGISPVLGCLLISYDRKFTVELINRLSHLFTSPLTEGKLAWVYVGVNRIGMKWEGAMEWPVRAVFDMERSGAQIAWDYFFEGEPRPEMIDLIGDRDLWRFAYGDRTKQFSAALRTYPMNFETWDKISRYPERLVDEGKGILRSHNANIEKFLADAYQDYIGGNYVPIANVPYHYASDTAHALLSRFPDAPFAACWFRRGDGMVQYSLRSEDSRLDVSAIAKEFGGGGHRNAAGFQVRA